MLIDYPVALVMYDQHHGVTIVLWSSLLLGKERFRLNTHSRDGKSGATDLVVALLGAFEDELARPHLVLRVRPARA